MAKKSIKERMAEFSKEKEASGKSIIKEEPNVLMAFRVPKSWPKKLRLYALQNDTTVQAIMTDLVEKEMKKLNLL